MSQIIYMITCKTTGKKYIGQTTTALNIRWNNHVSTSKNTDQQDLMLISRAIKAKGKNNFEVIELISYEDNTLTKEELNLLEEYYITEFNTLTPNGYNVSPGGGKHAVSSREKIALARKLHFANMSPDEKLKAISHLQQFQSMTEEVRQKMSNAKKQNWEDEEYRKRMEKTLVKARANNNTEEAKKKRGASLTKNKLYKLISPEGEEFTVNNLTQFAKPRGLDVSGLQKVAKGKLKHYKQWRCECLNDSGIRDLNKDYRELNKYLLTTPDGIQFCTYGLQHVKEQYGLDPNLVTRSARTGYKHKGWLASKVD